MLIFAKCLSLLEFFLYVRYVKTLNYMMTIYCNFSGRNASLSCVFTLGVVPIMFHGPPESAFLLKTSPQI